MLQYEIFLPPPARLFSLHIINMSNFSRSQIIFADFFTLIFSPLKNKKKKNRRLFLHKINHQHRIVHYLVSSISNLLIPRLRRIHYDMDAKQHEKLPGKPERKIKRQTIQQIVHQKVIPFFLVFYYTSNMPEKLSFQIFLRIFFSILDLQNS